MLCQKLSWLIRNLRTSSVFYQIKILNTKVVEKPQANWSMFTEEEEVRILSNNKRAGMAKLRMKQPSMALRES
jgi:hypothetical protein